MKKKIALLAGGYSGEHIISLQSAATIAENLDASLYEVYQIVITRDGWFYTPDSGEPATVDKNDFSVTIGDDRIQFDAAFIAIHGSPGEDGKLQGYLEMLQIPFTTCNSIVSALTFNKNFCNRVVRTYNVVDIARSAVIYRKNPYSLGTILEELQLPVFVKPNESGSSLGISKVTALEELLPAIERAFQEDAQVMIEEMIEGTEVTIGVYQMQGTVHALPPTELVSKKAFFDYEAKYTAGVTDEITPARISDEVMAQLNKKAKAIYSCLNCAGMVRMDFIIQAGTDKIYFLEVNTVPGQSATSLIPQQVAAAGMDLKTFYSNLLQEIL